MHAPIKERGGAVLLVALKDLSRRLTSNGYTEQGLLCANCDGLVIGKWEKYFQSLFFPKPGGERAYLESRKTQVVLPDGLRVWKVEGVDFLQIRLFFISIIWRAHLSVHPFFRHVDLGPIAERFREALITGNPDVADFSCVMMFMTGKTSLQSVTAPLKLREGLSIRYLFQIGQISLWFFTSRRYLPDWALDSEGGLNRPMIIPFVPRKIELDYLGKFFGLSLDEMLFLENNAS